jgi:hypothetical protein
VIEKKKEQASMGILSILWTIVVILFVLWLLGLLLHIGGGLIHILLIIAVIVVVYNLITHARSRRV